MHSDGWLQVLSTRAVHAMLEGSTDELDELTRRKLKLEKLRADAAPGLFAQVGTPPELLVTRAVAHVILDALRRDDDGTGRSRLPVFMQLPSREELPDYYQVIAHPMDINMITRRLDTTGYPSMEAFDADVTAVWKNAHTYNSSSSMVRAAPAAATPHRRTDLQGRHGAAGHLPHALRQVPPRAPQRPRRAADRCS